jgi:HEAT repeat protein
MSASGGKRTALWSIGIGLILLVAGGLILRNQIIDQWHIWNLSDEDQTVRWEAARRLGERGVIRATPRLIAALRRDLAPAGGGAGRPSPIDGSPIARALVALGTPALAAALEDRNAEIRCFAAGRLGEHLMRTEAAVPALTRALRFEDRETLLCVLNALSAYGRGAKAAAPRLIEMLATRRSEEWLWVAGALWSIDRRHPALPAALRKGLEDEDPLVRDVAAQYLGELGPQ